MNPRKNRHVEGQHKHHNQAGISGEDRKDQDVGRQHHTLPRAPSFDLSSNQSSEEYGRPPIISNAIMRSSDCAHRLSFTPTTNFSSHEHATPSEQAVEPRKDEGMRGSRVLKEDALGKAQHRAHYFTNGDETHDTQAQSNHIKNHHYTNTHEEDIIMEEQGKTTGVTENIAGNKHTQVEGSMNTQSYNYSAPKAECNRETLIWSQLDRRQHVMLNIIEGKCQTMTVASERKSEAEEEEDTEGESGIGSDAESESGVGEDDDGSHLWNDADPETIAKMLLPATSGDGENGRPKVDEAPLGDRTFEGPTICMRNPISHTHPLETRFFDTFRPLSQAPQHEVDFWFETSDITVGAMADTQERRDLVRRLCYTYKHCFVKTLAEIKRTKLVEHAIDLLPGVRAKIRKQLKYNRVERQFAAVAFPKMEEAGVIGRPDGRSEWIANTLFRKRVAKPGVLRIVHDFRPINEASVKAAYPCHNMETDIDSIFCGRPRVYSQTDASNGFWGIPIREGDQHKTSVVGPNGMWEYKGMPQGLKGAPSTYARFGDLVFGHHNIDGHHFPSIMGFLPHLLTSMFIFVDDHNFTSETFEEHFHFLHHHYFPRVAWAPIPLSGSKTFLFDDHATSVGFEICAGKIRPSGRHRDKFVVWKQQFKEQPPRTWEEVRGLLYLTPFVRKYIPGRADLETTIKRAFFEEVARTTESGKRSVQREWVEREVPAWGDEQAEALDKICDAVQNNATHGASSQAQFHIATDASDYATGAVLMQLPDHCKSGTPITDANFGEAMVIMWMSFRLSDQERRYSVPEKETLAIVRALTECQWLTSASPDPIMVYTDHRSIEQSMRNHGEVHGKLAKWIEVLTEHDVEYLHRPNTTKIIRVADGLSRIHDRLQDPPMNIKERLAFEAEVRNRMIVGTAKHEYPGPGHFKDPGRVWDMSKAILASSSDARQTLSKAQASEIRLQLYDKQGLREWYEDVVEFLLEGPQAIDHLSRDKKRLVRAKATRYRIQEYELQRNETDGSLARCIGKEPVAEHLHKAHDQRGHFGVPITTHHLRGRIFWPKRTQDVDLYIKSCKVCQACGPRLRMSPPKKISILEPWKMVAIDFMGEITPTAADGSKYILVNVDYFTKFGILALCKEASAEAVHQVWSSTISAILGWPKAIYCDNGSHFKNALFAAVTDHHDTKLIHGPASHPRSTGQAERMVRLVKLQLMKWAQSQPRELRMRWCYEVPTIARQINSRYVQSISTSPSQATLGRNTLQDSTAIDGFDDLTDALDGTTEPVIILDEEDISMDPATVSWSIAADLDRREEVHDDMRDESTRTADMVNAEATPIRKFTANDLVWEKQNKDGKSNSKFDPSWTGPHRVMEAASDVSYWITDITKSREGKRRKVHVSDLKAYIIRPPRLQTERPNHHIHTITDIKEDRGIRLENASPAVVAELEREARMAPDEWQMQ